MPDVSSIVENYFAPKPEPKITTLTKDMLFEMIENAMSEQEDSDTDPFALDPVLSGEEVASILLGRISQTSSLPKDAKYKQGRQTITLDNFGSLNDRDKILNDLMKAGVISATEPYRAGLSRKGLTNYYFSTKSGKKKFITLILKQGAGTVAAQGLEFEEVVAHAINVFLANNAIEDKYIAKAAGKFGKGSDIEVEDPATNEKLFSFETKTSKGSRVDFGQFRLEYNEEWLQATGKGNQIIVDIFNSIKDTLNQQVRPVDGKTFPPGPSLSAEEAAQFWDAYKPGWDKSYSADVMRLEIDKNLIQDYYAQKGDEYIILGNDIYSLEPGTGLIQLSDALDKVVALVRVKYHGPKYSYTVALRGVFKKGADTGFKKPLEIIFDI